MNIYTSDDTDCSWQAIKANIMKSMKVSVPTIDLHWNMVKGNTPLSKETIASVNKNQMCRQR